MLDELTKIADILDSKGYPKLADRLDDIVRHAQGMGGLVPKGTPGPVDPMLGYTDPRKVKVHTKRPKDTPIPGRPRRRPLPEVEEVLLQPPGQPKPAPAPQVKSPYAPKKAAVIEELVALAADLDQSGHHDLADQVDFIISSAAK